MLEKLSSWHNQFWYGVDPIEVRTVKAELAKAFRASQNPSRTGQMFYHACLSLRPDCIEPLIITLQPIGPDGKVIHKEPSEEDIPIELLHAHLKWKAYHERLADAKEWIDRDHTKHLESIERVGQLKARLAELIGEPACQKYCNSLII